MTWSLPELVLLALALAADAFSVGIAVGLTHRAPRQVFRLCFHFGLFQAGMALLGALLSRLAADLVAAQVGWIAFLLLELIGLNMLHEAWRGGEVERRRAHDRTRGLSLIVLSLATSIDALGAGVPLGLGNADLVLAVTLIGAAAALLTLAGMRFGRAIQGVAGRKAEYIGGLVLVALGLRMLLG